MSDVRPSARSTVTTYERPPRVAAPTNEPPALTVYPFFTPVAPGVAAEQPVVVLDLEPLARRAAADALAREGVRAGRHDLREVGPAEGRPPEQREVVRAA